MNISGSWVAREGLKHSGYAHSLQRAPHDSGCRTRNHGGIPNSILGTRGR
jgi:hypothetical protein